MASTSKDRAVPIQGRDLFAAMEFCEGLSRTLGPIFGVILFRLRPLELIERWGWNGRGRNEALLPHLASLDEAGPVVNHQLGRDRITILRMPTARGDLAVVIQTDTVFLGSAARALNGLANLRPGSTEPTHMGEALDRLIDESEERIGVPIEEMSRTQKQQVVKLLDDRGAFLLKKAVEQVAARLGVSRFTIYGYMDAMKRASD